MSLPARLPTGVTDELATRILRQAVARGLLPERPLPDWGRYHELRDQVRERFTVPETSVTPLMARTLYGIAHLAQPARILVIGSYCGNTLVWLAGPGFGPLATYQGTRAVGVDTDPEATEIARSNFAGVSMQERIELCCFDGHAAGPTLGDTFDLVLLDADDPVRRKAIYLSLLDAIFPHLAPGSLILAHDICVPLFTDQLAPYRQMVRADKRFERSLSLEIDPCGLELTRAAGGGGT